MTSKRRSQTLAVVLFGFALAGLVIMVPGQGEAREQGPADGPRPGWHGPHMRGPGGPPGSGPGLRAALQRLDLDDSQQGRIREILQTSREAGEPLRAEVRDRTNQLRELVADESAGDAALNQAVEAFIAARQALAEHRHATKEEVRGVLTPRQQAELIAQPERSRRSAPGKRLGGAARR